MRTVSEIIDEIGGSSAVARWLGVGATTVSEMKRRGRIGGEYWVQIVSGAHADGHLWLTHEYLAIVHAAAKDRLPLGAIPDPQPAIVPSAPGLATVG